LLVFADRITNAGDRLALDMVLQRGNKPSVEWILNFSA